MFLNARMVENTSYSQKLHIPASPSDPESLPINFWSFLPIPELQISHGWLSDHLSSLNKCKAEFRNLCIHGITRKCRNSWSFLPIPELQISHGWLSDHLS